MEKATPSHHPASAIRFFVSIFGLALALTACGGGGSEGLAGDPPLGPSDPPSGPVLPPVFTGLQIYAAAVAVFGQGTFAREAPNSGADTPDASSLFDPAGVAVADDGRVFIADAGNVRLLVLPAVPESSLAEAAFVLGQPDVFSGGITAEPDGYGSPQSVSVGAGKVAVADSAAHRVVIYESIPTGGSAKPTVVLGQPDFGPRDQGCDKFSLNSPSAVLITPDGRLIVADTGNSRVLVWNSIPTAEESGKGADVVLGQLDFDHCGANAGGGATPTRNTMRLPRGVWSDGMRLAVADMVNNRVLLWDDIRNLQSQQSPDRVLGQPDFDTAALLGPDRHTLAFPRAVASNGTHLAVSDGNHRVLLWHEWPSQDGQPASTVIGQRDFLQGGDDDSGESAQTLHQPHGIAFHQNKLLVIDEGNNRLLIYKSE